MIKINYDYSNRISNFTSQRPMCERKKHNKSKYYANSHRTINISSTSSYLKITVKIRQNHRTREKKTQQLKQPRSLCSVCGPRALFRLPFSLMFIYFFIHERNGDPVIAVRTLRPIKPCRLTEDHDSRLERSGKKGGNSWPIVNNQFYWGKSWRIVSDVWWKKIFFANQSNVAFEERSLIESVPTCAQLVRMLNVWSLRIRRIVW